MTEQKNRAGYCSLAALRYAEVLYQLKVPEEAIGETKRLWEVSEELPEVLSEGNEKFPEGAGGPRKGRDPGRNLPGL